MGVAERISISLPSCGFIPDMRDSTNICEVKVLKTSGVLLVAEL